MISGKYWAAALIAVSLLPNIAASAESAQDVYDKGVSLIDNEDYDSAITALNLAIRLDRNNADAYYYRGLAFKNKNNPDLDQAISDLSEAIRLDPDNAADAYNDRAEVYKEKRDLDQAIADYTEAIRLWPQEVRRGRRPCRHLQGQPRRRLQDQGRIQGGDRRLHGGHPARPGKRRRFLLQPWHGPPRQGRTRRRR